MYQRAVGDQGLVSSALGLGCMGMAGAYGPADELESIATIHRAMDLGVTLFDSSDTYGPYISDRLLGRALSGRRDDVVVATKFGGAELDEEGNFIGGTNGRPDYVRVSVERSLRNLGTDRIDLYYQHRVDPGVPVEETFGALGDLVTAGKIRYLGICEAMPETIRRANETTPLSVVQSEYSLFARDMEANGVLATVRELGIGFAAYAPLGRGFLTGAVRSVDELSETDLRRIFPRFAAENLDANLSLLKRIEEVAEQTGNTSGQIALAWLLAQGEDIVAIPGTRKRSHLESNTAASDIVLSPAVIRELSTLSAAYEVAGERVSPQDVAIQQ